MEKFKIKILSSIVLNHNEIANVNDIISVDRNTAIILVNSKRAEYVKEELPVGTKVELNKTEEPSLEILNKEEDFKSRGRKRKWVDKDSIK